ncbi:hypothetical protein J1N35_005306, partial [Gossypium stocksii]
GFSETRSLCSRSFSLRIGDGSYVSTEAVGEEVSLPQCESCLDCKMTKRSFNAKGIRANQPLELELSRVVEQSLSLILEKVVERPANDQQHKGIHLSGRVSKKPDFFIYDGSIYNTKANHEDDDSLTYEGIM